MRVPKRGARHPHLCPTSSPVLLATVYAAEAPQQGWDLILGTKAGGGSRTFSSLCSPGDRGSPVKEYPQLNHSNRSLRERWAEGFLPYFLRSPPQLDTGPMPLEVRKKNLPHPAALGQSCWAACGEHPAQSPFRWSQAQGQYVGSFFLGLFFTKLIRLNFALLTA